MMAGAGLGLGLGVSLGRGVSKGASMIGARARARVCVCPGRRASKIARSFSGPDGNVDVQAGPADTHQFLRCLEVGNTYALRIYYIISYSGYYTEDACIEARMPVDSGQHRFDPVRSDRLHVHT